MASGTIKAYPGRAEFDRLVSGAIEVDDANNATDQNVPYYVGENGGNVPQDWVYIRTVNRNNAGTYIAQIAYEMNNTSAKKMWFRQKNSSGWGDWRRFVFEGTELSKTVFVTLTNVAITDGTPSSESSIELDVSSYVPEGYTMWSANLTVLYGGSEYHLPYLKPGHPENNLRIERYNSGKIYLKNSDSGWGTAVIYVTMFCKRN